MCFFLINTDFSMHFSSHHLRQALQKFKLFECIGDDEIFDRFSLHISMLASLSRSFAMKRWFKPSDVKLADLFKVGSNFTEERVVTPDMTNNRAQLGSFVISTPALANSLHLLACAVVDDQLPANHHSLTRHSEIHHKEPIVVGETMKMNVKVSGVDDDSVSFDLKVTKESARRVVAEGKLKLKVVQTEVN